VFANFFYILVNIITPVFIIIGIGMLLQRIFQLDLNTLAKLNMYFYVPGIIFIKLYESDFSFDLLVWVLVFSLSFFAISLIVAWIVGRFFPFTREERTVFSNSIVFYNSGNYGIPVNGLAFKQDPFAMSVQIMTLLVQNVLTFSYGVFLMRSAQVSKWKAVVGYFKMPIVYAILLAVFLNVFDLEMPAFLLTPAQYIGDGLVSIALVTLGAQVAQLSFRIRDMRIWVSTVIRLVVCPALGLLLIYLFRLDGILAQALFISTAMPTSVNSAIIAQEYNNAPDMAARVVLLSTLLSSLTVSIIISLAWQLW
jgi:predicted permease